MTIKDLKTSLRAEEALIKQMQRQLIDAQERKAKIQDRLEVAYEEEEIKNKRNEKFLAGNIPKSSEERYELFNQLLKDFHANWVYRDRLAKTDELSVKVESGLNKKQIKLLMKLADRVRVYRVNNFYWAGSPLEERPLQHRYIFNVPRRKK